MTENRVVAEALDHTNYKIWSNCMEIYLLGQDLWDVIDIESEVDESSKAWRRKNALALHAIQVSCGKDTLAVVGELKSAKKAWDVLKAINGSDQQSDRRRDNDGDGDGDGDETVAKEHLETIPEGTCEDDIEYEPFVKATKKGDWNAMKDFLLLHPEAKTKPVVSGLIALHYLLDRGNIETGGLLLDEMGKEDLELQDDKSYTSFASLSNHNQPGVLKLLKRMVARNDTLPNIGKFYSVPVVMASWKGFKDTTRYLYEVTDKDILNPELDNKVGVELLINCINIRLFDIASEIVKKFPKLLQEHNNNEDEDEEVFPIHALAKSFSALKNGNRPKKSRAFRLNHWLSKWWKYNMEHVQHLLGEDKKFDVSDDIDKLVYNKARDFLQLVCNEVSSFDGSMLTNYVYEAMVEASKNGVVEFVSEMLMANPKLIEAHVDYKRFFCHAVENRQEKVYNLIYSFVGQKDYLLSCPNDKKDNILHMVAKLAPSTALDRTSGPALQMQSELQWFQEVWSLAKLRYREDRNIEKLTPRELFTKSHSNLIDAGEKAMKDTAQSSTVVGALIITVMFAAAFTVPGGNDSDTGLPIFFHNTLFKIFIVCDALSLYSSTTSVLVFLGILTSRYSEEDFFVKLPRKLIIGITTLFFSIVTMMISFCTALALMLKGELRYILPTVLLAFIPIMIFVSSIVPVLSEIVMSTFGPSIFVKTGKLLEKRVVVKSSSSDDSKKILVEKEVEIVKESEDVNHVMNNSILSSIDENMANEVEEDEIASDPTIVDKEEEKNIVYNPSSVDEIV